MKTMNKLLALLLALIMVFCLAACGTGNENDNDNKDDKNNSSVDNNDSKDDEDNESDAEKILGEWSCRVDASEMAKNSIEAQFGDDFQGPDISFYLILTFNFDDGELVWKGKLDEDSWSDYMNALVDILVDYTYEMGEEQGMSREEVEDKVKQESGMTVEEYFAHLAEQSIEMSADANFEMSLGYELDEDKGLIYIGADEDELESKKEAMVYKFSGSKLSITGIISDGEEIGDSIDLACGSIKLPWTFEKK